STCRQRRVLARMYGYHVRSQRAVELQHRVGVTDRVATADELVPGASVDGGQLPRRLELLSLQGATKPHAAEALVDRQGQAVESVAAAQEGVLCGSVEASEVLQRCPEGVPGEAPA